MRTLTLVLLLGTATSFLAFDSASAQGKPPEVPQTTKEAKKGKTISYYAHVSYDENTHETTLSPLFPEGTSEDMQHAVTQHAKLQFGDHEAALAEHKEKPATLFNFGKFAKSFEKKATRVAKTAQEGGDWKKTLIEQGQKGVKDMTRSAVQDPQVQAEVKKQASAIAGKLVEEGTKQAKEALTTGMQDLMKPATPTTGPKLPPPPPPVTGGTKLPPPPSNLPPPPLPTATPGGIKLPPPPTNLPPPPAYTPPQKVEPHPPTAPPRAGLLSQIRAGKTLKKVDQQGQTPKPQTGRAGLLGQIQAGTQLKSVKDRQLPAAKQQQGGGSLQDALASSLAKMRPSIAGTGDTGEDDDDWD